MASVPNAGQRGPAEHERREQIILAATEHFQHYGYEKTTVADLAKAIGLSKAYVYKFFDSKQSIGEAVCGSCLAQIAGVMETVAAADASAADRLRNLFRSLAQQSRDLFFHNRKMHDLAAASFRANWGSAQQYQARLLAMVQALVREGREAGEFERKTPLQEASRAIMLTLYNFLHPYLLQHRLDTLDDDATLLANLVLRSLAP